MEKPKKVLNIYFRFTKDHYEKIKQQNPDDPKKALSEAYKNIDSAVKAEYERVIAEETKTYNE